MSCYVYILYNDDLCDFRVDSGCEKNVRAPLRRNPSKEPAPQLLQQRPWKPVWKLNCKNLRQALAIGKHLEAGKDHNYYLNLMEYKSMSSRLLERFP